ncbi:hypothetical protein KC336_g14899, partial [Hortaea werneckii]
KTAAPETADDFQEAADREEEAGGKHRVGNSQKSARGLLRALDLYDQGLKRHPTNFDLAYNKARLLLEITQQPVLVEHVGAPDVIFNTSQVLIPLAKQKSEVEYRAEDAIAPLQEALEMLSASLSREEMLLEQQQMDFDDAEEGGVHLDPDEKPASSTCSEPCEQSFHASLSALTTIVALVEPGALQTFADMAHMLTKKRAPGYIDLLAAKQQDTARFAAGLDRAIFIVAFVATQFNADMVELES